MLISFGGRNLVLALSLQGRWPATYRAVGQGGLKSRNVWTSTDLLPTLVGDVFCSFLYLCSSREIEDANKTTPDSWHSGDMILASELLHLAWIHQSKIAARYFYDSGRSLGEELGKIFCAFSCFICCVEWPTNPLPRFLWVCHSVFWWLKYQNFISANFWGSGTKRRGV